jgi:alkaline phosphatase D
MIHLSTSLFRTRWTPETETDVVELELRVAKVNADLAVEDHLDPSKNEKVMRALITVTAEHDWIAKVDMTGLEAGVSYVYGFLGPDGEASRVGLTKTAPAFDADVEQVQYAVFSCSHFSNGYFHAYDIASTLTELDFWIHVGDYVSLLQGMRSLAARNVQTLPGTYSTHVSAMWTLV